MPTGLKCPSCGHQNLAGEDRCSECFFTLMQRDLPRPSKTDVLQNVIMERPISDLITGADLLVASESDTVAKVVKVLQKRNLACIVVYTNKKLVGILSVRDILWRVLKKHSDLSKVKVGDVMTRNHEYVHAHHPMAYIVNKMAMGGFRHVPVIAEDGTPITIVEIVDVLGYLAKMTKPADSKASG